MKYIYGMAVILLACLAGCKEEPPEPENQPPPPLTTEKIHSDYRNALSPLFNGANPNANFRKGDKNPPIQEFKQLRQKMSSEENEPEAKQRIEKDVVNNLKKARDNEQWFAVDGLLDIYGMLRPDSQVYTSLRRRANVMMARPVVVNTGFAKIGDEDLLTFLEITDPMTGEVDTFRVREGEEFYPDEEGKSLLKLIRVIGAQSGVEMEYLALPGYTWEVPGPENN